MAHILFQTSSSLKEVIRNAEKHTTFNDRIRHFRMEDSYIKRSLIE